MDTKLQFMTFATDTMNEHLAIIKQTCTSLKPQFQQLISDRTIPLDDRWALFTQSPVYIKNQKKWSEHVTVGGKEISWYDDFYIDRYVNVEMENVVEQMGFNPEKWSMVDIEEMKEFILAKNLHSFTNDW